MTIPFSRISIALLVLCVAAIALNGYSDTGIDMNPTGNTTPRVTMLESSSLVVGEPLNFYGENFLDPSEGRTKLTFENTYL